MTRRPSLRAVFVDANPSLGDVAQKLHFKLYPLFQALFLETNPIPVKQAVALMGKAAADVRLPLCPMSQENLDKLTRVMKDYGLI